MTKNQHAIQRNDSEVNFVHIRGGGDDSREALSVAWNRIVAIRVTNTDILTLKLIQVSIIMSVGLHMPKMRALNTHVHCLSMVGFHDKIWAKVAPVVLMIFQHVSPARTV